MLFCALNNSSTAFLGDNENNDEENDDENEPEAISDVFISEIYAYPSGVDQKYIELFINSDISNAGYYIMTATSETGTLSSNLTINILDQNLRCSGIVIKQKDNTYYISDINRELIIITSGQVLINLHHTTENPADFE